MKRILVLATATAATVGLTAGTASAEKPECNWGRLTAESIAGGFDQGAHASSFAGTRRAGLANVVERGNLDALCQFIASEV
jgi:hypothetical protein